MYGMFKTSNHSFRLKYILLLLGTYRYTFHVGKHKKLQYLVTLLILSRFQNEFYSDIIFLDNNGELFLRDLEMLSARFGNAFERFPLEK